MLSVAADFLFFKSMETGIVGIVVAIVASNFVLVTAVNALFGTTKLSCL